MQTPEFDPQWTAYIEATAARLLQQLDQRATQRFLTPAQAALYCGLTVKAFELRRACGTGPAFHRISTKTIRYTREQLDAWVIEGVTQGDAE